MLDHQLLHPMSAWQRSCAGSMGVLSWYAAKMQCRSSLPPLQQSGPPGASVRTLVSIQDHWVEMEPQRGSMCLGKLRSDLCSKAAMSSPSRETFVRATCSALPGGMPIPWDQFTSV